jgi:hypothetical protein
MNFPLKWMNWISAMLRASCASVLVNGSPTQEFGCYQGLRQGDLISPFLFILAVDSLTCIIRKTDSLGLIHGLRKPSDGPLLTHLLFADDVVFIEECDKHNAMNIRRLLRCFFLVLGLNINLNKIKLYGVGADEEFCEMASLLRCDRGSFPFKYLGLQVGVNMNLVKNWKPIDIFKSSLSGCKSRHLSYGGRITLIKSVLNSLPTYYFSLYKALVAVVETLEHIRRDFLWARRLETKKIHWFAWSNLALPKELGDWIGIVKRLEPLHVS